MSELINPAGERAEKQPLNRKYPKEVITLGPNSDFNGVFTRAYSKYHDPIGRYLSQRLRERRDTEDAEGLTNSVFTKFYEALPLHQRIILPGFLYSIAQHLLIDLSRHISQKVRVQPIHTVEEHVGDKREPMVEAEISSVLRPEILSILGQLDPKSREIIIKMDYYGQTYDEMEAKTGVSQNALRTRHYRARESFKQAWQQLHPEATD